MLHIPIVHAQDVTKQIPREKIFYRVENVIKQLVHTSAVRSLRYEARGKFGEHERCVRVARGVAFQASQVLHISMNAQLTYEPIVL